MITAGIDCGAKTIKTVIVKDGKIISKSIMLAGLDTKTSVNQTFTEALNLQD